jgi:hypothetical protein
MDIAQKLRGWIPNGDGYNSEFAHDMANAADEIDALRKDAERYRWLKNNSLGPRADLCVTVNIGHDWSIVTEIDELDEVIDAGMKTPNA